MHEFPSHFFRSLSPFGQECVPLRSGHLQEIRSRISSAVKREPRKRVWRVSTLIISSLPPSNSLEAAFPSIRIAGDDEIDVMLTKVRSRV